MALARNGDDAVPSQNKKGSPARWKRLCLQPQLKESLRAGTYKPGLPDSHVVSEVYDQQCPTLHRAEICPAVLNTFASQPLCTSW